MNEIEEQRGYLMLLWDGELILSSEFSGGLEADAVARTKTFGKVSEELAVALVLASVVAVAPPEIAVKLLSSIKLLTAMNEKRSDDELPF